MAQSRGLSCQLADRPPEQPGANDPLAVVLVSPRAVRAVVVNSVPSAAGGNSAMCAASASATTVRERQAYGVTSVSSVVRGACRRSWSAIRSVPYDGGSRHPRGAAPATHRSADRDQPERSPLHGSEAAWRSPRSRTCSTVRGTTRSRSARGRLSPRTGLCATRRSRTAALKIERRVPTTSRSVDGASMRERSVAHACTSHGRSATRRLEPSGVASIWVLINVAVRAAVDSR